MRLCVMVLESRERVERIAVIRMETLVCDEFYLREAARQAYAAKLHPVMPTVCGHSAVGLNRRFDQYSSQ